ncbi:PAS domain S-box protein [Lutibacter sp.]|uniref:PAS domain-containing hybrid sensor histidine kinase/response regulator n=1 Tax=Lutibacter sp. TaxID=1925666 RepID=UPI003562FAA5
MKTKLTYQELEKELEILKSKKSILFEKSKTSRIESENKFKNIIENAGDAMYMANFEGQILEVNKLACTALGYNEKELLCLNITELDANFIEVEKAKKFWNSLEVGKSYSLETKHKRKDGSTFPVEIRISVASINNNKVTLGFARDITERKVAEKQLKESERLLKEAQIIAKIGYWELNLLDNKLTWSDEVFRVFNLKPQEFKPTYATFLEKIHPKDKEIFNNTYLDSLENNKPFEITLRLLLNSNEIKYVLKKGYTEFNEEGKPLRSLGTIQDITERKQAEIKLAKSRDKLKASEQKFRQLYEKSGDAIMIGKNGKFSDVNDAAVIMFGYTSKKEFLAVHPKKLSPKLQPSGAESFENSKVMLSTAQEKGTHRFEWFFLKKNGKTFPAEILLTSISNKKNNKIIHGVLRDITNRKRIESELIEAKMNAEESDRLKTEFISNMSHEIRTPMNGIMGFSELLADSDLIDEKRKYFVKIIKNSGKQLLQIIDDIIEISKLGTKQVKVYEEPVNLNDLLLELFSIFDSKAKENKTPLYLEKGLSDKQSAILTDKSKLNKIVSNLLENALKFTNIGFIEFGYKLKNNKESSILEIYVKDTGIGIKTEDQKLIFERFIRANKEISKKVKGLGLGLSIAKENTVLLGGEILVESIVGKGTTFFVTIPYKPVFDDIEITNDTLQKKTTILIVEDEEINYLYLDTLLKDVFKINCTILHAKNGKEAIDICKTNITIDMILMDLKMPVMNGYDATKEIKKLYPSIPIIAQTAYSTKEEQKKAIMAGCDNFISKPITKDSLFNMINKFVPQL